MNRITAFINKIGAYTLLALLVIAINAFTHIISAFESATLFQAVMPIFGVVTCIALALITFASPKTSLIKLVFVFASFTTFWVQ
jgi:hypothetical protein